MYTCIQIVYIWCREMATASDSQLDVARCGHLAKCGEMSTSRESHTHTQHAHPHTHVFIYICVCVWICAYACCYTGASARCRLRRAFAPVHSGYTHVLNACIHV